MDEHLFFYHLVPHYMLCVMLHVIFVCFVHSLAIKPFEVIPLCIIVPTLEMTVLRIRKVVAQTYMSRVTFLIHVS